MGVSVAGKYCRVDTVCIRMRVLASRCGQYICVGGLFRVLNLIARRHGSSNFWAFCVLLAGMAPPLSAGQGIYEAPDAFVNRHFDGAPPKASMLYPDAGLKKKIKSILGHRYSRFRIRYWLRDGRSVWVLEEIGKEKFITAGFMIEASRIGEFKVLVFRESRGWEVRYASFADQFTEARLITGHKLDRGIDNITGATLSVRAMTKLARLALLLHQTVMNGS